MSTDQLLSEVLTELKGIKKILSKDTIGLMDTKDASEYLGGLNPRVLTYWAKKGLIEPVKKGRECLYSRHEIVRLGEQIRLKQVFIPTQTQMKNERDWDSFLFSKDLSREMQRKAFSAANAYRWKSPGKNWRFSTRKTKEGIRIWRVK